MATYLNLTVLTDLGFDYDDALRALQQHANDANLAANSLINKRQRQSRPTAATERAGPSCALATPPKISSPETILIESDHESDADGEPDVDAEGDDHELYAPPTPSKTPAATFAAEESDEDAEADEEDDDLYAMRKPIKARKTTVVRRDGIVVIDDNDVEQAARLKPAYHATQADDEKAGPLCVCQEAHDHDMVQCTACRRWFHLDCVNLDSDTVPGGDWYCHFEAKPTSKEINRPGTKFDALESRALFVSVKHFAPLGKHFWEDVSRYLKTQFNINRSQTSSKFEWLRNSSAIWGFDERDTTQYSEAQVELRKKLMRSLVEGKPVPLHVGFRSIGWGKKGDKSAADIKAKPAKQTKRKQVILEDTDDEDELPIPANKRRQLLANKSVERKCFPSKQVPSKSVGGKFGEGKEVFAKVAPRSSVARKSRVTRTNDDAPTVTASAPRPGYDCVIPDIDPYVEGFPGDNPPLPAAAAATATEAQVATTEQAAVTPCPLNNEQHVPQVINDELLLATYPTEFSDYQYCYYDPPLPFQSRFEALAEHRRHVKEMLKDIEPNLDWYEGPWESESELLWTSGEEYQIKAMFE